MEAYQLLKVNFGIGKRNKNGNLAWSNHPAAKMWKGYERVLWSYTKAIIDEWKSRGYKDTVQEKMDILVSENISRFVCVTCPDNYPRPPWLGLEELHSSHRSALLYKDYEYYKQFNWKEEPKIDYIWPV